MRRGGGENGHSKVPLFLYIYVYICIPIPSPLSFPLCRRFDIFWPESYSDLTALHHQTIPTESLQRGKAVFKIQFSPLAAVKYLTLIITHDYLSCMCHGNSKSSTLSFILIRYLSVSFYVQADVR